jgi:SagB-type dehydrogenase family enzyme
MPNQDTDAAWKYHNGTKHSPVSLRSYPHFLDWDNQPLPFKIYPTLEVMRLTKDWKPAEMPALSAIAATGMRKKAEAVPDLNALAQILFLSAGVTKSKKYPGGEIFFRAAACTGALYEIEIYIVCGDLPGLSAGVYQFGVAEFGLRQLRAGDFRRVLVDATADHPAVAHAPLILICTGIYWRNAWKYRSRTYRHFGWDNGTILANLLAVTTALCLPTHVLCGFVDATVNRLLDVDTPREVAFTVVPVGRTSSTPPPCDKVEPLGLRVVPYSKVEVDYPAMRQMHEASALESREEATAWRKANSSPGTEADPDNTEIPLKPLSDAQAPRESIDNVILRRGSTRKFARAPITLPQLSTLLDRATRGIPADFLNASAPQLNDIYLLVNDVQGLSPGSYFHQRARNSLQPLKEGNFREQAGYLGLEQALPADAAVNFFFLANLTNILARLGNRGYRCAQLEAGIIGGKLYLAAYAQGLGASGLTFYDDEVVKFFSPHAKGKSATFLVAVGRSAAAK